jgi:hypothetical protein
MTITNRPVAAASGRETDGLFQRCMGWEGLGAVIDGFSK